MGHHGRSLMSRFAASVMAAVVLMGLIVVDPPAASAAPTTVTVTVLRLVEVSCDEGDLVPCPDDYFARVDIDSQGFQETDSIDNPDVADVSPHWTFTRTADTDDGSIPVEIQIWDHDASSENDLLDASPVGDTIDLSVDLATGSWSGDSGTDVGQAEGANVRVFFDITVGGTGDIDGDGIPNIVELNGVRDAQGNVLVDMQALGADPCRKSIAVEIDFMTGAADGHSHRPRAAAITEAVTMFDNAPVASVADCPYAGFPRAATGIDFLVVVDDSITEQANLEIGPAFDAVRADNFDPNLRPYFHYVLFVHNRSRGNSSSGVCCSDGRDAIVSLGSWANQIGLVRDQSGTLVHELGHAWGFGHGGLNGRNCKPNYLSVMNYSFQFLGVPDPTLPAVDIDGDSVGDVGLRLDFSRSALPNLNENAGLSEPLGIQAGTAGTFFNNAAGVDSWDFDGGAIDWDGDNAFTSTGVTADVNQVSITDCGQDGATPPNATPSPNQTLVGFDDWANLKYRAAMSPDAGFDPGVFVEELTAEDATAIRASLIDALRPDLVADVAGDPNPVLSGDQLTWTISARNDGQGPARDVELHTILPQGVTLLSCSPSAGGTCSTPPTATWTEVAAGDSVTVDLVTTVACAVPDAALLTASSEVTTSGNEKEPSDNTASGDVTVSNPPPVVDGFTATPNVLWPPDGKMRTVELDYTIDDNCGAHEVIVSVDSDEPVDELGDGTTSPDWIVSADGSTVELRAERSALGDGRTYNVTLTVVDAAGHETVDVVEVDVPLGGLRAFPR